jgi:CheY-like chemotaxis protein
MSECAVILLAEDDEDYVFLIRRAFADANIKNPLYVVPNGEDVISYLEGKGKYSSRAEYPLPDLLLLDINMPRVNGFEALAWIRQQPNLASLRILVLTSSDEIRDVNKAYQLGANSFLVKPYDFQDLTELTRLINDFWLRASRAPENFRPPRPTENGPSSSKNEGGKNI